MNKVAFRALSESAQNGNWTGNTAFTKARSRSRRELTTMSSDRSVFIYGPVYVFPFSFFLVPTYAKDAKGGVSEVPYT